MATRQSTPKLKTPLTHSVNNTVASSIETHALATPIINQETNNFREEITTELITPIIEQEASTLRQAIVTAPIAPMLLPSVNGTYVDPYDPDSIRFINNKCVYTCTGLCCAFDSALAPYQTQLLLSPVNINGTLATTVEQALHMINTARTQLNADWNATSGVTAIRNKPVLASVATLGTYNSLIDKPDFADVAYTGCYCDLCGLPTIPAAQVNSDWLATEGVALICNKPTLSCVACSGDYNDLLNTPDLCLIQQQSDWNQANSNCPTYIKNKPELARVATSGLYADLLGAPSIPEQVNSDWLALSGPAYICNKPSLSEVALSGDYNDLRNIPPDTSKTYTFSFDESTHKLAVTEHGLFGDTVIFNDTIDTAYSFEYEDNTLTITDNRNNTYTVNIGTDFYTKCEVNDLISAITDLIPEQASSTNQLADKNFVNSSIATNTANFCGTFNNLACLCATVATPNDYAFYAHCDTCGNCVYDRYKYNASCVWVYEYTLNNSSFTAAQWAAINSGITDTAVAKITDVYNCTIQLCNADGTALLGSFTLNQNQNTCICLNVGGGTVTGINVYCSNSCICTIDDNTALCLSNNAFNTYAQISTTTYPGACCTGTLVASDLNGYATCSWVTGKGYTTCKGTVTQVKVGTAAYNPSSGIVTLPAYPPDLSSCAGLDCTGCISSISLNGCAFTVTDGTASLSNFYPACTYGNADGLVEFSTAHVRNANWSVRNVWNQCGDNHSYLTSVKNNWECTSAACVQPVSVDKAYCSSCALSILTCVCDNDAHEWYIPFMYNNTESYYTPRVSSCLRFCVSEHSLNVCGIIKTSSYLVTGTSACDQRYFIAGGGASSLGTRNFYSNSPRNTDTGFMLVHDDDFTGTTYCNIGMDIDSGNVNRGIFHCKSNSFEWLQYWDADYEYHTCPIRTPRIISNGYPQKWHQTINLVTDSSNNALSTDCFYPVTFPSFAVTDGLEYDIEIQSPSGRGSIAYNQNYIHFYIRAGGWSDTPKTLFIQTLSRFDNNENLFGCIGYGASDSYLGVIWLRGGATYYVNANTQLTAHTTNYTHMSSVYTVGTSLCGGTNTLVGVWASATTNAGTFSNQNTYGTFYNRDGCAYILKCDVDNCGYTTCTGTVTVSDNNESTALPLVLCTGTTSVGRSTVCPLTFNPATGVLKTCCICSADGKLTTCTGTVTGINVYCGTTCKCTIKDNCSLCLGAMAWCNNTSGLNIYNVIDFSNICAGAHCINITTTVSGYWDCTRTETWYYWVCPSGMHASYIHTSNLTTDFYVVTDSSWRQRYCSTGYWFKNANTTYWCSGSSSYSDSTDSWTTSYYILYMLQQVFGNTSIYSIVFPALGTEGYGCCTMLQLWLCNCCNCNVSACCLWANYGAGAIDYIDRTSAYTYSQSNFGNCPLSSCSCIVPFFNLGMMKCTNADSQVKSYINKCARFKFTVVHALL